jgi:glyoxalase family protein
MTTRLRRLHHITVCPAGAQDDIDFFTQVLGQRLVKQTVLMDGRVPIYHFYYGNADGDCGSITTSFPYGRKTGRAGSGQVSATAYVVPPGTMSFWAEHFDRHHARHSGSLERFGRKFIRVAHPAGMLFELVEDSTDSRRPWTTREVSEDVATRGFFGAVLSTRDLEAQEQFFTDALGFTKIASDGSYHRFAIDKERPGQVIDLLHEPDRAAGSWGFGAGTTHHIAFEVDSDDALLEQKAWYEELGFTDASEIKDRYYFHSMYVRSPGGVLVECTSNVDGGFYQDEAPEDIGTELHLPPWYEEQREAILSMLEPIVVPDENRPRARRERSIAKSVTVAPVPAPRIPLSRTKAAFAERAAEEKAKR